MSPTQQVFEKIKATVESFQQQTRRAQQSAQEQGVEDGFDAINTTGTRFKQRKQRRRRFGGAEDGFESAASTDAFARRFKVAGADLDINFSSLLGDAAAAPGTGFTKYRKRRFAPNGGHGSAAVATAEALLGSFAPDSGDYAVPSKFRNRHAFAMVQVKMHKHIHQ
eukprot:UN03292